MPLFREEWSGFDPYFSPPSLPSSGCSPVLLEKSLQAKFLIPMATSLSFGVLFATFITLLLVPSLYLILEDLVSITKRFGKWTFQLYAGDPVPEAASAGLSMAQGKE